MFTMVIIGCPEVMCTHANSGDRGGSVGEAPGREVQESTPFLNVPEPDPAATSQEPVLRTTSSVTVLRVLVFFRVQKLRGGDVITL